MTSTTGAGSAAFRLSANMLLMSCPAVAGSMAIWRMHTMSMRAEVCESPGLKGTWNRRVTLSEHASHSTHKDVSLWLHRMDPTLTPSASYRAASAVARSISMLLVTSIICPATILAALASASAKCPGPLDLPLRPSAR